MLVDIIIVDYLKNSNYKQIKKFCNFYSFYISSHLYPLLIKHEKCIAPRFYNWVVNHICIFYPQYSQLFRKIEPRIKKTAIITIHNRYDIY